MSAWSMCFGSSLASIVPVQSSRHAGTCGALVATATGTGLLMKDTGMLVQHSMDASKLHHHRLEALAESLLNGCHLIGRHADSLKVA